jgi:glycosyltransferase involved in cell wall biosynthesis
LKLLLISYLFPPAGGIAVQRALSLARYLPESGCEVHVLSARNAPAPVMDPQLIQRIPGHVQLHHAWTPVIPFSLGQKMWQIVRGGGPKVSDQPNAASQPAGRARIADLVRRILCPDPEVLWRPFCFRQAKRLVEDHGIECVLITAPPFSSLLTGVALKREFPHLTLVSDFRDGWLDWYVTSVDFFDSPIMRERAEQMERAVVEASDLVVSVTASLRDKLKERYSDQLSDKFVLVPNGFDPALQANLDAPPRNDGRIRVTYMGTLYRQTSARYYLDALDALPHDIRDCFETHIIGRVAGEEVSALQNRRSRVVIHGFLPQSEALRRLATTDLLLVTMTDPLCHTGKVFEYLATGKPILAFTPPHGELAQILDSVGGAWIVDPVDHASALSTLHQVHSLYASDLPRPAPDPDAIRRFERPRLAARYIELIRAARSAAVNGRPCDLAEAAASCDC